MKHKDRVTFESAKTDQRYTNKKNVHPKDEKDKKKDNENDDQPKQEEITFTKAQIKHAADSLMDGAPIGSIDPNMNIKLYHYLKRYKNQILRIPDYYKAQRIDDICSQLLLLNNSNDYSKFTSSQIDEYQKNLENAQQNLQLATQEREDFENGIKAYHEQSLQNLKKKQKQEIDDLEREYSGEVPLKYRKYSNEILLLKRREFFLQKSGNYLEAKKTHEEMEALSKFEYEQMKIKYLNLGIEMRDKLYEKHRKQIFCLNENIERKRITDLPRYIDKEKYFARICDQLKVKIQEEKDKINEAKTATNNIMDETHESGLPKLGSVVPSSPTRKVSTVNNIRKYTRIVSQKRSTNM